MNISSFTKQGARNGVLTALYIGLVVTFMQNASRWFGAQDIPYLTGFMALSLFVISALITGSLVLWQPVTLLIDGQRKEAVTMLVATVAAMFALLVATGIVVVLR